MKILIFTICLIAFCVLLIWLDMRAGLTVRLFGIAMN